jgi:Ca2+-binding RTX toxin-like protein
VLIWCRIRGLQMAVVSYAFFARNEGRSVINPAITAFNSPTPLSSRAAFAILPDGSFVVVYSLGKSTPSGFSADGPVFLQRVDANGSRLGDEIMIAGDGEGSQRNPVVSILPDGRIAVAWLNASTGTPTANIQVQMLSASLVPLGPPSTITFSAALGTQMSFGGGSFDLTALPDNTLLLTMPQSTSGILRSAFNPTSGTSTPLETWAGVVSLSPPSVTVLRNGTIVTTASNELTPRGSEVLVFGQNTPAGNSINGILNDSQQVIALADGGYAIVWRDSRYGFSDDISLRLFNADNSPRTPIINANAGFTSGSQGGASVTQMDNGFLVVSWVSGSTVLARVFDLTGSQVGGVFDFGGGSVVSTHLITLADNTFAVNWTGSGGVNSRVLRFVRETQSNDQSENLSGDALRDLMLGAGGNDTLRGLGGDDFLAGEWGEDSLEGGDGNDRLIGGSGHDTLDGGNGIDTASYELASGAVTADLSNFSANSGEAFGDVYMSIENILGSSFDDRLRGDSGSNLIDGAEGDDILSGGSGNDTLIGGIGVDILNGEAGFDTLSYQNAEVGITIFLGGRQFNAGEALRDTYSGFEAIIGSGFADILGGDDQANELRGNGGNDFLIGAGASDTLIGGNGNDVLSGGDDQDRLEGNDGVDVAYYRDSKSGVSAGLARGGYAGEAFGDSFFEIENIWGSRFDDVLAGDNNGGQVYGFEGNDNLSGLGGDDFFYGGTGSDTIVGGTGADSAFFLSWNDHVNQFGTPEPYEGGDTFTDFTSGTDKVILSRYWFGFGNIGGPAAALTETHANFVTDSNVATGRPSLIWSNTNRTLSFDADGNGATQAVLLGTFQGGGSLALSDIWTA